MPTIKLQTIDAEGCEVELELPAVFEVCPRCNGEGHHDHPAFSNGITGEEWNGPDWDDDSRETYMRGGYDVPCEECRGDRVVPVIDRERCTQAQQKEYDDFQREEYEYRAECAAERAMGA